MQRQGGQWVIVGVGYDGSAETAGNGGTATNADFLCRLAKATAVLAENGLTADVRYIDDPPLVIGLAGSDGQRSLIVSLGDHLGMTDGQAATLEDVSARIHEAAAMDAQAPRGPASPLVVGLIGVAVLGAVVAGGYIRLHRAIG
ncbi:hypothetical protein [Thermaerobacter sp. PB12/4term]|uniref:hypothetical protein n=1 Tax=Thermaerobacter sp. PB12/4term TaxID=2293838 RepID=UPI001FAD8679|nr:hypothetical protein [Thermaerobacter sp. PB12/4term]